MKHEASANIIPQLKKEVRWMAELKSSMMEISVDQFLTRAIQEYVPTKNVNIDYFCSNCGEIKQHQEVKSSVSFPLTIGSDTRDIHVEGVPTLKCSCGEESTNLSLLVSLESIVDEITEQKIREKEAIPTKIDFKDLIGYDL